MIWSLVLGVFILLFVFWDLFLTIFSLRGGGPATNRIGDGLWNLLLRIHGKRPIHKVLSFAGPFILVLVVLFWYFFTAVGWLLIFISKQASVINNTTQASTTLLEKLYFTGVTVSDLGYGDLIPQAFPWTLMSSLAALSGTLVLSAALSYILPVISAGLQKRTIAKSINGLGSNSAEMIDNIWSKGGPEVRLYLVRTLDSLQGFTFQHLSYPILLYFHAAKPQQGLSLAVVRLADAIFLVTEGAKSEDFSLGGYDSVAQGTIDDFSRLDDAQNRVAKDEIRSVPKHLSLQMLAQAGIETVDEAEFSKALDEYLPLRARLCKLCERDGWGPGHQ